MEKFFNLLDSIGFKSIEDVETLISASSQERPQKSLDQFFPNKYLSVITSLISEERKSILLKKASSINLFIKTKFNETDIFIQWSEKGIIPYYYHNGLNTKKISLLAKKIIRLRNKIESDKDRVLQLEGQEKLRKTQVISLEKSHERIRSNKTNLIDLEDEFYFEFVDFESSLGGIY